MGENENGKTKVVALESRFLTSCSAAPSATERESALADAQQTIASSRLLSSIARAMSAGVKVLQKWSFCARASPREASRSRATAQHAFARFCGVSLGRTSQNKYFNRMAQVSCLRNLKFSKDCFCVSVLPKVGFEVRNTMKLA